MIVFQRELPEVVFTTEECTPYLRAKDGGAGMLWTEATLIAAAFVRTAAGIVDCSAIIVSSVRSAQGGREGPSRRRSAAWVPAELMPRI